MPCWVVARSLNSWLPMLKRWLKSSSLFWNVCVQVGWSSQAPKPAARKLIPDNLPQSDPSKMNFGSGGNSDAKAWKDIWGCGQGIGAIKEILTTADLVARLRERGVGLLVVLHELPSHPAVEGGHHLGVPQVDRTFIVGRDVGEP